MPDCYPDYFPAKLAKAPRFCNRVEERAQLQRSILLGRHTILVSPRRYGKSSLAHQVVLDMAIPYASIDLFLANDGKAVTKRILDGVSDVIAQIMPLSQKALSIVQKYFSNFKVVLEVGRFSLQLSHAAGNFDAVDQIFEALKALAKLAVAHKKKVLVFLDEFQDIANAENSKAIQGAIRHVAQDSDNLVFAFSGSNRHLLLELFEDKNKPLYMLCDKIFLDRIASADYAGYIQEAAYGKWKKPINELVLNRILTVTELHPFYVNLLCNELWKASKAPTTTDQVMAAWLACYELEERRLIAELEKLTPNQQNILKVLALAPVAAPMGQKFLQDTSLSLSSTRIGIKSLLEKDMIYQLKRSDANIPSMQKGQYRILDPLLGYALRKYN
jgi:AAA+ ATPase superfamily predicted ATPase